MLVLLFSVLAARLLSDSGEEPSLVLQLASHQLLTTSRGVGLSDLCRLRKPFGKLPHVIPSRRTLNP